MNSCESFEQLISLSLDEPLATESALKLEEHLKTCPACTQFRVLATRQSHLLRSLPIVESKRSAPLPSRLRTPRTFASVWRSKLTIPVPLAAGIVALALCWGVWNVLRPEPRHIIAPPAASQTITYVQVERVSAGQTRQLRIPERP